MLLHEGRLINRTVIKFSEGTAVAWRTLLDLMQFIKGYEDQLNRIVIYVTLAADTASDVGVADNVVVQVKTYGMTLERKVTGVAGSENTKLQELEFPLGSIGIPVTKTDIILRCQAASWGVTETHTFLVEVQAYLLEFGPQQLLVRTF